MKEGQLLKKLKHANIVKCYDVYEHTEEDPFSYIVMELMSSTLEELIDDHEGLPEKLARDIFIRVVRAVEYCHQQEVIHHDLKPANVLLKYNDEGQISKIKLADFGLNRSTSENLVAGVDSCGTLDYSAPEMF